MKPIRINNIELRRARSLRDEVYWEIVYWYPNPYYGCKDKFVEVDGGIFSGKYYGKPDNPNWKVHEDCFKNPENCYTVATLETHTNGDEPDIVSVGRRPWDLNFVERESFDQIIKHIFDTYYDEETDDGFSSY